MVVGSLSSWGTPKGMRQTSTKNATQFLFGFAVWLGAAAAAATPLNFSDFAIYGTQSVRMELHHVSGAPIGSSNDLQVTTSNVESIYGVGNIRVDGSPADVAGDIVAMGTVELTQGHDVTGSVHSSAPVGTLVGAEVLGPATATIGGDVVALGDVSLANVITLEGSVHSGGDLAVALDGVVLQDTRANGSIYLGSNVQVSGDVVYGTTLSVEPTTSTGGSTSQGTTVVTPETFAAVSLPGPAVFTAGSGTTGTGDAGSSLASPLLPGTYGTLEAKDIYLTGGTYIFSAIDLTKKSNLYLDLSGDPIEIFVEGDVSFDSPSQSLNVFVSEDGVTSVDYLAANQTLASKLWLETHGTFRTDKRVEWFGAVYAPFEGIDGELLSVVGALYAGGHVNGDANEPGIKLLAGSAPQQHIYVAPIYSNPVPEPGTAMLLALGLVAAAATRRPY